MSPLGGAHLLLPSQALLPHSLAGRAAVFCSTLQYPCIQPCHARAVLPRAAAPQALIVPPRTVIPPGYQVVLENSKMCGGEEFYVPGSTHRSWNKEWPVLRILMRQECNPAMAHMGEPTEFEELLDCNAVLQPQHAQQAAQQYQQYTARYAAGAAGAQQQPFAASAPKPWGYFGSYGWPG